MKKNLANCLECVKHFADEIIIVDTGSQDKTVSVAHKYTNKVYFFEWVDDFAKARNFSFSKATCEYIMWLDADDIIPQSEILKILKLKKDLNKIYDIVIMKYISAFDENGEALFYFFRERIIKNNAGFKWQGFVHEVIPISGNVLHSDICIHHNKKEATEEHANRNLKIYENALKKNIVFTNRDYYYYGRELYYHRKYKKAIKFLKLFLKQEKLNTNDIFEAHLIISDCYVFLNDYDKALSYLIANFKSNIPNSKLLCKIGDVFFEKNDYAKAIFWYENAVFNSGKNEFTFIEKQYGDIYPYLQLCVCYYKLNDLKMAVFYNKKAEKIDSKNQGVQLNNKFFKELNLL